MKHRLEVTFTGYSQYQKQYQGINEWTELSFLQHNAYNYTGLKAKTYNISNDRFKRILDYAKLPSLEVNKKYELWEQDYHDNHKFTISGIKLLDK